jgi:cytochrome c-type biogenesis protein CcmH
MLSVALAVVLLPLWLRRKSHAASRGALAVGPRNDEALNAVALAAQRAELDRALAAGTLTIAAHRALLDDLMRRVLCEAEPERRAHIKTVPRWPALAVVLALPALAVGIYLHLGNPAALAGEARFDALAPGAGTTRADVPVLTQRLEAHLRHAPQDARAWVMLARLNFAVDRFDAAAHAYEQAFAVSRKVAQDPDIWCELADALGMQQGGSLAGRPRELIERALALRSDHARALEMAGSAAYESGDYAGVLAYWEPLLAQLAPQSTEHGELAAAIERTRRLRAQATRTR